MPRERLIELAKVAYKDYATTKDVAAFFKQVISAVQETRRALHEDIKARLAEIKDGKNGKDGRDGKDGKSIVGPKGERGERGPVGRALFAPKGEPGEPGKDGSPDTPLEVREKLETLEGEDRLKAEAIQGLEQLIDDIKNLKARPAISPGRSLLQLYVNGAKKGAVQYLNITGAGVSYASANGRNDVTITGSGGALSVLAATGTVDDSNTTFTFVSEPTLINVNGATYVHGHGCTIAGTTVTLDAPAGTGGFVYGLG